MPINADHKPTVEKDMTSIMAALSARRSNNHNPPEKAPATKEGIPTSFKPFWVIKTPIKRSDKKRITKRAKDVK